MTAVIQTTAEDKSTNILDHLLPLICLYYHECVALYDDC